jgi:hemoglobin
MINHSLKRSAAAAIAGLALALVCGCMTEEKKDKDFFTSGSREADQRAEQRIAKDQQIKGKGMTSDMKNREGKDPEKKPLFERLGGQQGIETIVNDFVARALADPRVNWERKGVKSGGVLGLRRHSVEWKPDAANVDKLKKHLVEFLALSTGGPTQYGGGEMKNIHKGMQISNSEFDAAVGDLKATLDKLQIPTEDQKELLSVIESTRPQVVEVK